MCVGICVAGMEEYVVIFFFAYLNICGLRREKEIAASIITI